MTVLIAVETLLLVLLSLLVAGLLRSHAEILRRLGPPSAPGHGDRADVPAPAREETAAADIVGTTVEGDPVKVAVQAGGRSVLLAFLSSGCVTCEGFWEAFDPGVRREMPGDARLIVVTKDSEYESPSRLRALAPPDVPVVMSSVAWEAYGVPVSPYFIFVDGRSGHVHGEGTASSWPQVLSLLRDALADAHPRPRPRRPDTNGGAAGSRDRLGTGAASARNETAVASAGRSHGGAGRALRADEELGAAGINAGHPSLYVAGDPSAEDGPGGEDGRS